METVQTYRMLQGQHRSRENESVALEGPVSLSVGLQTRIMNSLDLLQQPVSIRSAGHAQREEPGAYVSQGDREKKFAADMSSALLPRAPPAIHHVSLDVLASVPCRWESEEAATLPQQQRQNCTAVRRWLASTRKPDTNLTMHAVGQFPSVIIMYTKEPGFVLSIQIFQMSPAGLWDENNPQKALSWRLFKFLINH